MLDAQNARLTKLGTVAIDKSGIVVSGFEGEGTGCREVAVLATVWALGELQRELLLTLQRPGGGNIAIGGDA